MLLLPIMMHQKMKEALKLALALRDIIEEKCKDEYGYLEAFNISFVPEDNEKLLRMVSLRRKQ